MKLIFVLVLAFVCFVYGHNINAIVRFNAKTYAFDGFEPLDTPPDNFVSSAFEIVGGVQTNVFSLSLPNTSAVPESSIVIGNFLYQFSGAYGSAVLSKYSLPFTTNPVMPTSQAILANQIQGIPAIFNVKDNIAFALLSRYLTLIDLSNLNSRDSVSAAIGTGKFPGCLVYNQKNQKVYYFQTNYCYAGYCQHIYEFKVNLNTYKLNPLDETFTPNYTATFNEGSLRGCDLDLDNNNIWCLQAKKERLYKFPINNLNSYTSIKLPPGQYTSGNVAFNFNTNRAYVSISNSFSYTINEINLLNGNVPRSGTFSGGAEIESMTIANNALLLGFRFKGLRQMSSINLANLNDNLINLYV